MVFSVQSHMNLGTLQDANIYVIHEYETKAWSGKRGIRRTRDVGRKGKRDQRGRRKRDAETVLLLIYVPPPQHFP